MPRLTAKEIGDRPAFPKTQAEWDGMSYRNWLIGMAVAGRHVDPIADADYILDQLAQETEPPIKVSNEPDKPA